MSTHNNSSPTERIDYFNRLQDPHLVSAFQNYFGVVPIRDSFQNGSSLSQERISKEDASNEQNGYVSRKIRNVNAKKPAPPQSSTLKYKIDNKFWYYVFSFGTSLGYEVFYATFFPFWMWNLDGAVCRRVVNVWVVVMYIGQALKDLICWPRPASPPVVHLEPKYIAEYGMPSTHALISAALPFSFLYFTINRYEYSLAVGLLIACIWCILVCCSRLYMGMHTVLDLIGGLVLAPPILFAVLPIIDVVDTFQMTIPYSPLITAFVMVFFLLIYPKTPHYSPSRGDTAVILGTGTGFATGTCLNYHLGYISNATPVVNKITWPNLEFVGVSIFRTLIGILCILLIRMIIKTLGIKIACAATQLDPKDVKTMQQPKVELPVKFATFIGVGMAITFFGPACFRYLGILRLTMKNDV